MFWEGMLANKNCLEPVVVHQSTNLVYQPRPPRCPSGVPGLKGFPRHEGRLFPAGLQEKALLIGHHLR